MAKNSGGTTIATYTYAANGDRITEAAGGTTTGFYYNGPQIIEQRQGGTVTSQNVFNIDYVNDLLLRDDNSTSGNLGISGSGLGQRLYVQHDANFDTTALTNTSGVVQERFIYSPYGTVTVLSPSWSSTTDSFGWGYLYQGMWRDPVTGLYYTPNRDYSAALGRWIEQDPARYINGADLYSALRGNPASRVDPLGMAATSTVAAAANAQDLAEATSWLAGWSVDPDRVLAAEMLGHYLQGTGDPYELTGQDIGRLKSEDNREFLAVVRNQIHSDYPGLSRVDGFVKVKNPGFQHYFTPLYPDLFFAFGTLNISYEGTLDVCNGHITAHDLFITLSKTYNFDPANHSILDYTFSIFNLCWQLEVDHVAKRFDVHGSFHEQGQGDVNSNQSLWDWVWN